MKFKHILIIDPLEELVIKKDSSLLFALELQKNGHEVFVTFPKNIQYSGVSDQSRDNISILGHSFEARRKKDSFYLDNFEIKKLSNVQIDDKTIIHQRMDPPFDLEYLNLTWLLAGYESRGIKVLNSAKGLLAKNEKIIAFEHPSSIPTYIVNNVDAFNSIRKNELKKHSSLIIKPLDLYQGLGVEKINNEFNDDLHIATKLKHGPLVIQPFYEDISKGEVRSFFFAGKCMGNILKVPKQGEFLANIAQGASFDNYILNKEQERICEEITTKLLKENILWVAFDLLGNHVNEVNITCPGLLVELCEATQENLIEKMVKELSSWAR